MNDPIDPEQLSDTRDQAAYWFMRQQSGSMTEDERQACAAWRRADPDHERQFRLAMALWDAAGKVPAERMRALGYPAGDRTRRADQVARDPATPVRNAAPVISAGRRRFAYGVGAAFGVAAAAATGLHLLRDAPQYQMTFATRRGERRSEELPDGSRLDVNGDTTARVRFYPDRRTVELQGGEILCRVAPDPARPFTVDTDTGLVRAVGTCFDVRYEDGSARVAVAEGEVEVRSGPWWRHRSTRLTAGYEARLDEDGEPSVRGGVDVAARTAWRDGRIVFNATRLADAMDELNRYLAVPVRVPDSRVRGLRISGIFRIDEPGTLLAALPRIIPVQVLARADGGSEIVSR
ncbi:FecR family protein [Achromobacter aloeverae]